VFDFIHHDGEFRAAQTIRVGRDALIGKDGKLWPVTNVQRVFRYGQFYPVTKSGKIIVDGLLVSCFNEEAMKRSMLVSVGVKLVDVLYQVLPHGVFVSVAEGIDVLLDRVADWVWMVVST
jgi:hypothetical protein